MRTKQLARSVMVTALAVIGACAISLHAPSAKAQSNEDDPESRIDIGFQIAPVPLKVAGKNRVLVGLGSYWVNAIASECVLRAAAQTFNYQIRSRPERTLFGTMQTLVAETFRRGGFSTDLGLLLTRLLLFVAL